MSYSYKPRNHKPRNHSPSVFEFLWGLLTCAMAGVALGVSIHAKLPFYGYFAVGFTVGVAIRTGMLMLQDKR